MTGAAVERASSHRVLALDDVVVSDADRAHVGVMHGSMRIDAGDLAVVRVANLEQAEIWADVASGLLSPEQGRVTILGNDLAALDLETGNRLRGRIGRVFGRGNWLDRLSMMDNILIQARHHSARDDADLRREASALAESFDMPGIPLGMPDGLTPEERQRAACVRAFLDTPVLVILEDPTRDAGEEMLRPLMGAIRGARNRGAAVLWLSPSREIWRDATLSPTRRYRMAGRELMKARGR